MAESLSDLLNWAKYVDHGIRQLECYVERNGVLECEVDPDEVSQKFRDILEDVRATKISAQNDIDQLKVMSEELKDVISLTESEEMQKIDSDLRVMLDTLFPNETSTVEETIPPDEAEPDSAEDVNLLVPLVEEAALSPGSDPQPAFEESYAEVEISPFLVSKIPRSRLATGDLIPESASRSYSHSYLHPIRRKTLLFSPSDSTISNSPIPEQSTPHIVLQDRTNVHPDRFEGNAKRDLIAEETIDSPEVIERPTRPVLTSHMFGRSK